MGNRKERLPIIVDILTNKSIGSQEELLNELAALGINVTQATLSRDLRLLKTSKISTGLGGYRYVVSDPESDEFRPATRTFRIPDKTTVNNIERSDNIIVIKLPAILAKDIAQVFESRRDSRLYAAVAIGSTILLILAPGVTGAEAFRLLTSVLPTPTVAPYRLGLNP